MHGNPRFLVVWMNVETPVVSLSITLFPDLDRLPRTTELRPWRWEPYNRRLEHEPLEWCLFVYLDPDFVGSLRRRRRSHKHRFTQRLSVTVYSNGRCRSGGNHFLSPRRGLYEVLHVSPRRQTRGRTLDSPTRCSTQLSTDVSTGDDPGTSSGKPTAPSSTETLCHCTGDCPDSLSPNEQRTRSLVRYDKSSDLVFDYSSPSF